MKKRIAICLCFLLAAGIMTACGSQEEKPGSDLTDVKENEKASVPVSGEETAPTENGKNEQHEVDEENGSKDKATEGKSNTVDIKTSDGTYTLDLDKKGEIREWSNGDLKISLDGSDDLYEFDIAVSELLDNGWEIDIDVDRVVKANTSLSPVKFTKNGTRVRTTVSNKDGADHNIVDCYVSDVAFESANNSKFTLPGGICENSTPADVYNVLGDPNKAPGFDSGFLFVPKPNSNGKYNIVFHYECYNGSKNTYKFTFNNDGKLTECLVR